MDLLPMFNADELELLSNDELFILKASLTKKLNSLFVLLSETLKKEIKLFDNRLWEEVVHSHPKISRGEQYKGFPWMVLDYPRVFRQEDVFAFRSLCWWGHEFSFTLHIGGKYLDQIKRDLPNVIRQHAASDIYICISDSPWNYYFEKDNYILLSDFLEQEKDTASWISNRTFVKLSKKTELQNFSKITTEGNAFLDLLLTHLFKQ